MENEIHEREKKKPTRNYKEDTEMKNRIVHENKEM